MRMNILKGLVTHPQLSSCIYEKNVIRDQGILQNNYPDDIKKSYGWKQSVWAGTIFLAVTITLSLSGCGGGGTAAGTSTTITGSAGDGPVQFGAVSVTNVNGPVTTTPPSPNTGSNAQFSFTVPSGTALPLTITVTGGTDTVTRAAQDFPLRTAVTTLPANGTVTGNANPLSTLAVASALAQGGGILTSANLATATTNVLGAMGFGLPADPTTPTTGINPISTPVTNTNAASIVRASEAAAELIRRASNANPGLDLPNTILSIAQDLTDGIIDGNVAPGATATQVSATNASHILNQQAQVSVETLANNLTVTTPAGTPIPTASGANFATSLNASIVTIGHTGSIASVLPTQAFLDQTRSAINTANVLVGGGNAALNNLLGGINAVGAGSPPSSLTGLITAATASFTAATTAASTPATAAAATTTATTNAADTTAPLAPTLTAPLAGLTNINTPTVSGSAEATALVTVLNGLTLVGTATAAGSGAWTLTSSALADGAHTLTATATDAAGNTGSASAGVTVTVDTTAPTLTSVSIASNNANAALAKAGDVVTVTFTSSETLGALPTATIATKAAVVINTGGNNYTATYTMLLVDTQGFTAFAVNFVDTAGNTGTQATAVTDASGVAFDSAAPTLTSVSIASNNANAALVKAGDVVTVTFTSSETLGALPTATIATKAAVVTNTGGNNYTATYTMLAADTQGATAFTINFADSIGNAGTQVTAVTDASAVAFDSAAPTLISVSIASNNATTTVAKAGDVVTVTFTSSETLGALPTATIATNAAVVTNTGGNNYRAAYTMVTADAQGATAFTINFADNAGNAGVQVAVVSDATVVAFDSIAPTATLATTAANPTSVSPIPVTLTFNEPVTGVTLADFTVGNGTAGNLVPVSSAVYTVDITQTVSGAVTIGVAANVATDSAGNGNAVAMVNNGVALGPQLSIIFNNVPVASNVTITDANGGSIVVGDVLTGGYTYADVEGDAEGVSTFRWLRNGVAIGGATAYTLVSADIGKAIIFEVTPVAVTGTSPGIAATSAASTVVNSVPIASTVTIANASVTEGNSGTSNLVFHVSLSVATIAAVTVNYATSDGTARAATDYTAKNAKLVIPAGNTSGTITVLVKGDTVFEQNETLTLTLSAPSVPVTLGTSIATGTITNDDIAYLNDTGISLWGNATVNNLTVTQPTFPRQDADVGRDANPTLNSGVDGRVGFSFTKLDNTGAALVNQAAVYATTPWSCVQDNVTGLMWEVKTTAALGGLRDAIYTYTWYNSTGVNDGGSPGTTNGGTCVDTANCDTEKYVAAVNAVGLCGYSNWRLPSRGGLLSIVDYAAFNPSIERAYFPNTRSQGYWSASPDAGKAIGALLVSFGTSGFGTNAKSGSHFVRLVRGGQ